jgi:hypothetical protein
MVTSGTLFFGYGSLVNLATHTYQNPRKASVNGWRRQWVYSSTRDLSFLSVAKDPNATIQGLVADVSDIGWDALDIREAEYKRLTLTQNELPDSSFENVQIYVADRDHTSSFNQNSPILLSYIDCVTQGFLEHFGTDGVAGFFNSTKGWDRPVQNDRAAPIYPRAQVLTTEQTRLVDHHLEQLDINLV